MGKVATLASGDRGGDRRKLVVAPIRDSAVRSKVLARRGRSVNLGRGGAGRVGGEPVAKLKLDLEHAAISGMARGLG